jgi:hypothetical protein
MPRQSNLFVFYHPNNIWSELQTIKLLITLFFHYPITSFIIDSNTSLSIQLSKPIQRLFFL